MGGGRGCFWKNHQLGRPALSAFAVFPPFHPASPPKNAASSRQFTDRPMIRSAAALMGGSQDRQTASKCRLTLPYSRQPRFLAGEIAGRGAKKVARRGGVLSPVVADGGAARGVWRRSGFGADESLRHLRHLRRWIGNRALAGRRGDEKLRLCGAVRRALRRAFPKGEVAENPYNIDTFFFLLLAREIQRRKAATLQRVFGNLAGANRVGIFLIRFCVSVAALRLCGALLERAAFEGARGVCPGVSWRGRRSTWASG